MFGVQSELRLPLFCIPCIIYIVSSSLLYLAAVSPPLIGSSTTTDIPNLPKRRRDPRRLLWRFVFFSCPISPAFFRKQPRSWPGCIVSWTNHGCWAGSQAAAEIQMRSGMVNRRVSLCAVNGAWEMEWLIISCGFFDVCWGLDLDLLFLHSFLPSFCLCCCFLGFVMWMNDLNTPLSPFFVFTLCVSQWAGLNRTHYTLSSHFAVLSWKISSR